MGITLKYLNPSLYPFFLFFRVKLLMRFYGIEILTIRIP